MITFLLNDRTVSTDRPPGYLLLDLLRDDLRLTGTREGCREGDCGACTVLLGEPAGATVHYRAVNSCLIPLGDAQARHVVTVEGLHGPTLTPVQSALVDEGAIQCGFCTPGFVMALTGFALGPGPFDTASGIAAVAGCLCRCTGYASIRRAVARVCRRLEEIGGLQAGERIHALVRSGFLPPWLPDAVHRLSALDRHTPPVNGIPVGGGTDLFVRRAEELREAHLQFLSERKDLQYVREEEGECRIGGATTLAEVEQSAVFGRAFPSVTDDFSLIASLPIRNRATLAGNFVNASPAADLAAWFLPLDTRLLLRSSGGGRTVELSAFFRTYKQVDLKPGEIITEICVPLPTRGSLFHFEKVCCRDHMDIAAVNSAVMLRFHDGMITRVRLSAGGVAPVPLLLRGAMEVLEGRPLSAETVGLAAAAAAREVAPISDVRGGEWYKRELVRRLVLSHFLALFPQLPEEELVP